MLEVERFRSLEDFEVSCERSAAERTRRREREIEAWNGQREFFVDGVCYVCGEERRFYVDLAYAPIAGPPNWRERVVCERCGLNSRMRAAIHLLEIGRLPLTTDRIYLPELTTALYRAVRQRYREVVGSEFLTDEARQGLLGLERARHEDLTELSFATGSFDVVLLCDVLEHVPDYLAALAETRRILKPHGAVLVTVPFRADRSEHVVRARVEPDGEVQHLELPEYHGDPLRHDGCLAYYHFGWKLLDELRGVGFGDSACWSYWSHRYGYVAIDQFVILATLSE